MCAIRALNRGVGDQQGNLTRTIGFMESNQDLGLAGNFSTSQQQHTAQWHQLSVPSSRGWSQGHPTPVSFPPLHASPLNTTSSLELSDPAPCPLPHLSSSESSSPPRVWLAGLGFPGEKGFFFFLAADKVDSHIQVQSHGPLKAASKRGIIILTLLLVFSRSVVSDSLRPHGLQHTRLPCPSPSPGVCSNSCPLSQ